MVVWSSTAEQSRLSEQDVRAALQKLQETTTTLGPHARVLINRPLLYLDDEKFWGLCISLFLRRIYSSDA